MALIDNKFKLEKFKKFRCFSGRDVDARAATSVGPQKSGSPGGLRGVPVLAETQAARHRVAASVSCRPRGGEDAEEGFPGWGTNGGANPILAGCLFLATVKN